MGFKLKNYSIVILSSIVIDGVFCSTTSVADDIQYCTRMFLKKEVKVFLKDEGIEATMIEIIDKKTKKVAFGYFMSAVRNDTNFIYSRIKHVGDTIINTTYRDFKITPGTDSVITRLLCTPKGLRFYDVKRFWNGKIVEDTTLNTVLLNF